MNLWIKLFISMLFLLSLPGQNQLTAQADPLSNGVYRIPYADGTEVRVTRDHIDHTPINRIDMIGINGTPPYTVVAAADGVIRYIEDNNTGSCNITGVTGCASCNNYVWIEHPNGEWTKYTHFITGSVAANNWSIGDTICAGAVLGLEGDIGSTRGGGRAMVACNGDPAQQALIDQAHADSVAITGDSVRAGVHLHFEVAIPDDINNPFDTVGGFINGRNYIPIICDISGNIFVSGNEYTANPCLTNSCDENVTLSDVVINNIDVIQADNEIDSDNSTYTVSATGQVHHQAGNRIILRPGFRATSSGFYQAIIEGCNGLDGTPFTNCPLPQPLLEEGDSPLDLAESQAGLRLYPNPATQEINVVYQLDQASEVSLEFYDVNGRRIVSLEQNQRKEIGVYQVNANIEAYPDGSYLCVLRTETEVRKRWFVVMD